MANYFKKDISYTKPSHKNDLYGSVNAFKQMQEKNIVFQAYERLTRPPVWHWEPSKPVKGKTPADSSVTNDPYDSKKLRILSVTWNLHGKMGPKNLDSLLRNKEIHHDIYIVGTQECMRSIAASMVSPSKEKWEQAIQI